MEPKMVLQSDAIEEPFLVPQRTFKRNQGSIKEPFPQIVTSKNL